MSVNVDLGSCCGYGSTTGATGTETEDGGKLGKSLITIAVLIVIIYLFGGRVFGGYGNYPGYGGYSIYGYTPKPKRYKYFDDYLGFDEPDY
jgi:hypothetical protein